MLLTLLKNFFCIYTHFLLQLSYRCVRLCVSSQCAKYQPETKFRHTASPKKCIVHRKLFTNRKCINGKFLLNQQNKTMNTCTLVVNIVFK